MIQVEEIMNTQLFTLKPENKLAQAKELMAQHGFRHIPIVGSGQSLVGIVTHRDLLSSGSMHTTLKDHVPLKNIMTANPFAISPNLSVKHAAQLIKREKFDCLPVVEQNKLVGLVTATDFVGVAITLVEIIEMNEPLLKEAEEL